MAQENELLEATKRVDFGKGAARRMRREGLIPAVVYGHGVNPDHITVDYHTTWLAIRGNANALIRINLEGSEQLVLVKDRQINPLSRKIEHLDLLRVKADEKVEVEVPIEVSGEPFAGAVATLELMNLLVQAPVNDIPEAIVVDVEGAEDGTMIRVGDLKLPAGVTTETDGEEAVVIVAIPQEVALPEAGEAAAESGEAAE